MQCLECRELIATFIDDELDPVWAARVSAHLAECRGCQSVRDQAVELRATVKAGASRFDLPTNLERRVRSAIATAAGSRRGKLGALWTGVNVFASIVCGAFFVSGLMLYRAVPSDSERLAAEITTSHTRSLIAGHLTDVASSDQHTVKPWLAGRVPYSPPVVNLAEQGFPLAGARLDYVAGQTVAVLVYRRREHLINLYVWPDKSGPHGSAGRASHRGYQQVQWVQSGMRYWASSDLNPNELDDFRNLLGARIDKNV